MEAAAAGQPVLPYLLHGVTGSGKTEIYLQAVEWVLAHGRQAHRSWCRRLPSPRRPCAASWALPRAGGPGALWLSPGERYDTWRRARAGAGFGGGPAQRPVHALPDLGLIVVDECHDDSITRMNCRITMPAQAAVEYAAAGRSGVPARLCHAGYGQRSPGCPGRVALLAPARSHPGAPPGGRGADGPPPGAATTEGGEIPAPVYSSHYRPLEAQAETIDLPPVQVVDMRRS